MKQFKEYMETIKTVNELPFVQEILDNKGEIFTLGGAVRDSLLGKESKDLDILIRGISIDKINFILKKYGTVNLVGQKFGVIKWKEFGSNEDIDIAIPRTEIKTGPNRTDFEVSSDPMLPLVHDLYRRDFSFNAISKKLNGEMIDPYNGRLDIKNKIIRMINPDSFDEKKGDPLRLLRAIGFSSRFSFKIEEKTLKAMRESSYTIKSISKERIFEEFKKMLKGDKNLINGISYLIRTKLFFYIFGFKKIFFQLKEFKKINHISELLFMLSYGNNVKQLGEFIKNKIAVDNKTEAEINMFNEIYLNLNNLFTSIDRRLFLYSIFNKYKNELILNSSIIPPEFNKELKEFKNNEFPKLQSQVQINGSDIMNLGYQGKQIKEVMNKIMIQIFSKNIKNTKQDILEYLNAKN